MKKTFVRTLRLSFRSLDKYAREGVATPSSPSGHANIQGLSEEEQASEDGRAATECEPNDDESAASKSAHRRPVQEKLDKEIANYNAEIEMRSKTSGAQDASRVVLLKKLRAACESKLKRIQVEQTPLSRP